jgi:hypothetical protein
MKGGLALIHKIWSDLKEKDCECGEGKVEEWKQKWDEIFMNEVGRERRERERKEKCSKMFGDRKK